MYHSNGKITFNLHYTQQTYFLAPYGLFLGKPIYVCTYWTHKRPMLTSTCEFCPYWTPMWPLWTSPCYGIWAMPILDLYWHAFLCCGQIYFKLECRLIPVSAIVAYRANSETVYKPCQALGERVKEAGHYVS